MTHMYVFDPNAVGCRIGDQLVVDLLVLQF